MNTLHRYLIEQRLRSILEEWAEPHLAAALEGDIDAASNLVYAASNDKRGILAVAFWRYRVPIVAYRTLLSMAWDHDHELVINAAGNRRTLRAMFSYAAFPLPELPDVVRVWRGTSGITRAQAARGLSWTLERDVACWFAMRHVETSKRTPLVLACDVPRADILLYHDERGEKEVVTFRAPTPWIDDRPEEWRHAYEKHQARIRAHNDSLTTSTLD